MSSAPSHAIAGFETDIEAASLEVSPENDIASLGFAGIDVQKMAAEGYFQAIAYWLNEPLLPQQVYAQVLADEVPGRLKVLVEYARSPLPERLTRFVCDRIYKLNSDVIEGVHLIARGLGAAKTDWEKSVRIPTATQRELKQAAAKRITRDQQQSPEPIAAEPVAAEPVAAEPAAAAKPTVPRLVHESSRVHIARQAVRSQFQFFRAALVTGAAAAAFLFGGFTELVLSDKLSAPATARETMTPWYGEEGAEPIAADFDRTADYDLTGQTPTATTVSFRPASRFQTRTVEAALETVAVSSHDDVANPSDPTITLLFGGELSLNDFTFEAADDLDHLFSDIDLYQQADVAMLGLAEPLANASTSLQEDFYHRTRPQAVQALKSGGIDIVGLATEGALTYGSMGLGETLTNLDRQGIYRVGAGRDQTEAHRPEILEVKGQRIAYLGYNSDAIKGAKAEKAGVALTTSEERSHIIEDIKAIRSQVDWIVVNYRWGNTLKSSGDNTPESTPSATSTPEKNPLTTSIPEDWQKSLAREAVDAGADLVVGYHPETLQGVEIYHDRAIAYSLGDFVFDQAPLADHDTAALRVSLRNQQMKVEFLPITIRDSKLQLAKGDHGASILQTIRNASKSFEQPMRFPAVLDAKPNRYLPASQHKTDAEPTEPLPFITEEPNNWDYEADLNDSSTEPPLNPLSNPASNPLTEPNVDSPERPTAPDPMLREPDALFMPAEEKTLEEIVEEAAETTPDDRTEAVPDEFDGDMTESWRPSSRVDPEEWLADEDDRQPWQDPWEDESLMEGATTPTPYAPSNSYTPPERPSEGLATEEPSVGEQSGEEPSIETAPIETAPTEELWFDDLQEDTSESDLSGRPDDPSFEDTTFSSDSFTAPYTDPVDISVDELASDPSTLSNTPHNAESFAEPVSTFEEQPASTEPGVIAPYAEPLVGPLSSAPSIDSPVELPVESHTDLSMEPPADLAAGEVETLKTVAAVAPH